MQVYALRFFNFFRYGEKDNSVVFDISPEDRVLLDKKEITLDEIYDKVLVDPVDHVKKVKERGHTRLIGIAGVIGDNYDLSNGVGKSTILEGICYAHYEQVVRRNVNTDKTSAAGLSVVTKINGKYPPNMKESWVEEIFEENGKVYRIRRGRTFTSTQQSSSPLLEFVCFNDKTEDSQAGHRKADTNESINSVNSMDYDLFVNSVLFGQSDAGKFLTGTDKTRKEMLVSLLKLEGIINGCLDNIRKRKNLKEKDIEALNAKIDVLDNNLKSKESLDSIKNKINIAKINIEGIEEKIKDRTVKIEELSRSEVIKLLEDIRADGKKLKNDILAQEAAKNSQTKEWDNLCEETSKKIKLEEAKIEIFIGKRNEAKESQIKEWNNLASESDKNIAVENTTIKNLNAKLKETQDQIAKLENEVKAFNLAAREDTIKRASKARELKPKIVEAITSLQVEKEKIFSKLALKKSEYSVLDKEVKALKLQRDSVNGDDFVCDKCKSKVNRKHIEDEINRICDLLTGYDLEIKQIEMDHNLVSGKLTKSEANLVKANELLIDEGAAKSELKGHESCKAVAEAKKSSIDDYVKRIDEAKLKVVSLNTQKEDYVQKSNKVSRDHDLETSKMVEEMTGEIKSLKNQKEEYILKKSVIAQKYDVEIQNMGSKLDEISAKFVKAKKDAEDVEGTIKQYRLSIENLSKDKSQFDFKIGSLEKDIENIGVETDKLQKLKEKYVLEIALLNRLVLLDGIFGLEGIQTRIVKKYLPLLNNYIKEILDILSDGEMRIRVYINDKGKIDIAIEGGMADNFTMTSGGEKMIERLAIDIGLALLSFTRCASKPELICLDEVFDPLDAHHTQAVFRLINKLQDRFNRIIVISHKEDINKIIKNQILIEKGTGIFGKSKVRSIT